MYFIDQCAVSLCSSCSFIDCLSVCFGAKFFDFINFAIFFPKGLNTCVVVSSASLVLILEYCYEYNGVAVTLLLRMLDFHSPRPAGT